MQRNVNVTFTGTIGLLSGNAIDSHPFAKVMGQGYVNVSTDTSIRRFRSPTPTLEEPVYPLLLNLLEVQQQLISSLMNRDNRRNDNRDYRTDRRNDIRDYRDNRRNDNRDYRTDRRNDIRDYRNDRNDDRRQSDSCDDSDYRTDRNNDIRDYRTDRNNDRRQSDSCDDSDSDSDSDIDKNVNINDIRVINNAVNKTRRELLAQIQQINKSDKKVSFNNDTLEFGPFDGVISKGSLIL